MTRVLVTGGAGFVGSHLVDRLVHDGHQVRVLDVLLPQAHPRPPAHLNPGAEYLTHDVNDPVALARALKEVDTIYHLAAAVGIAQSMYQVHGYVRTNVLGTAALLQWISEQRPSLERLVVASSMSVYGEGSYACPTCGRVEPGLRTLDRLRQGAWELRCERSDDPLRPVPTPEDRRLAPSSVYGITKREEEALALLIGRTYEVPTVALRLFGTYGPRQSLSNPYTGVASIFLAQVRNGQSPTIFEDGQQTRDLVHVRDVIEAMVLAAHRREAVGFAINVGTGQGTTVRALAESIIEIAGGGPPPRVTGRYRAGDVRHCTADISRARRLLGFNPQVRPSDGLRELVAWARAQPSEDRSQQAREELERHGLPPG